MVEFTNDINKIYAENNILTHLPERYYENKLVLLVRDPYYIFAHWEIKEETKNEHLSKLGGEAKLILRVFKGYPDKYHEIFTDIHYIDALGSYHIEVGLPDTAFFTQIGYLKDGQFYPIATSGVAVTPRDTYSDILDEEWMAQEEYYRGLRKLIFDVHGSPFAQDRRSLLIKSKRENISSDFLKQETAGETVFLPEEVFEKELSREEFEALEESLKESGKPESCFKEFSEEDEQLLHPKVKKEISAPPDKITEEPAAEPKHKEEKITKKEKMPIAKIKAKKTTVKKTAAPKKKAAVKKTAAKKIKIKTKKG